MSVRIATFNVENLMARFDFSGWRDAKRRDRTLGGKDVESKEDYRVLEQARVIAHEDDARQMTALAIADCGADIVCLQEVENLETLEAFERNYLARMAGLSYPHKVWVEGNDTRGIDVALMAREETADGEPITIRKVTSHKDKSFAELGVFHEGLRDVNMEPDTKLFRRDCLEVDLKIGGKPLTLYICHFKSMGSGKDGLSGRERTQLVREAEAKGVRRIIENRFGADRARDMRWLICGDLNDYRERLVVGGDRLVGHTFTSMKEETSGLEPLFEDGFGDDLLARRPADDRWTLHYATGLNPTPRIPHTRPLRHLVQLDYMIASPRLARDNGEAVPDIIRSGLPHRTILPEAQDVPRYPRTGWDRPKASDHCPVAVTLDIV
ncbi:MAG: endonuclease/exonuclease/phosphatase family protein [Pseudomonadota bacterium]